MDAGSSLNQREILFMRSEKSTEPTEAVSGRKQLKLIERDLTRIYYEFLDAVHQSHGTRERKLKQQIKTHLDEYWDLAESLGLPTSPVCPTKEAQP